MDTIVLNGAGPAIRLKMGSDLRVSEGEAPKIAVIDNRSIKTLTASEPVVKLEFVA